VKKNLPGELRLDDACPALATVLYSSSSCWIKCLIGSGLMPTLMHCGMEPVLQIKRESPAFEQRKISMESEEMKSDGKGRRMEPKVAAVLVILTIHICY
jgi:hypothetical protein